MFSRVFLITMVFAASAAAQAAEKSARATQLAEVCRVELKDRTLDVTLVGRKTVERAAVIAVNGEEWTLTPGSRSGFALLCEERQNDRWSHLHVTSISRDDAGVTIAGIGRAGNSFVSVTYTQDVSGGVRLSVQRARRMRARPLDDDRCGDVVQLFNEHQPQVRMYLMPLLDELAADNPLRPGAADVYRAFATIPADPVVTEKVRALLPDLDSDAAAQRDAASAKLEALGAAGVLAVLRMDHSELTPEQRARLDALVDRRSVWSDPLAARRDVRFLADCLLDDDADVSRDALQSLRKLTGREVKFDVTAPPPDRRQAVAELLESIESAEEQTASDTR